MKVCGDQSLAFRTADFRSSRLRHWLALQYLDDHEAAPGKNAMDECLNAVEARESPKASATPRSFGSPSTTAACSSTPIMAKP